MAGRYKLLFNDFSQVEHVGGVTLKAADFQQHSFFESWTEELHLIDRTSKEIESCIKLEFNLEPVFRDYIRFMSPPKPQPDKPMPNYFLIFM